MIIMSQHSCRAQAEAMIMMVHKKDREKKTYVHEATPEKEETSTITEEDYRRICLCQCGSALNLFACCFFCCFRDFKPAQ